MKKLICILGATLLLSGCSTNSAKIGFIDTSIEKQSNEIKDNIQKSVYIKEDVKKVIEEINALNEEYKDRMDMRGYGPVYINIYEEEDRQKRVKTFEFNNRYIFEKEYFDNIVEILDKSLAKGLKEYVKEMENKKIQMNDPVIKKIGRTIVSSENRGETDNYIYIQVKLSDIKDEDYRNIFNKISKDRYVLNNVILGEKQNLIDFGNLRSAFNIYGKNNLTIRYNMFFEDKDIEKVNILLQGNNGMDLKEEDIDVFINLLNTLELGGNDKDILIKEYKNILKNKGNTKKIDIDGYDVFIKYNKGKIYGGNDRELIYFSVEKI